MNTLREYLFSVICAALVCGIAQQLFRGGSGELLRVICGAFLAVTVLAPIKDISWEEYLDKWPDYPEQADIIAARGASEANESITEIIKQETQAYILDKAAQLNADISVEVTLSEEELPVPASVSIRGKLLPQSRQRLQSILEEELGISREDQIWIG